MSRARDLADSADLAFDGDTLKIDSANNRVGIGTASPDGNIHIFGNSAGTVTASGSQAVIENNSTTKLTFLTPATNSAVIEFGDPSDQNVGSIKYDHSNNSMPFTVNASEVGRWDSSGNLLVGTTNANPASNNVAGVALKSGASHFSADGAEALRINRKTSDGQLVSLRKDATEVGSIGSRSGSHLHIGSGDTAIELNATQDAVMAFNPSTNSTRDAAISLGTSSIRFKDLYLSGGAYIGGTGSANYLDDYEEGTFTPVLDTSGTNFTSVTYSHQDGFYVKIGKRVFISGRLRTSAVNKTGATGYPRISSLPFTAKATHYTGIINVAYSTGWDTVAPVGLLIDPNASAMFLWGHSGSDARSSISGQIGINNISTTTNDVMFEGSFDIA